MSFYHIIGLLCYRLYSAIMTDNICQNTEAEYRGEGTGQYERDAIGGYKVNMRKHICHMKQGELHLTSTAIDGHCFKGQ